MVASLSFVLSIRSEAGCCGQFSFFGGFKWYDENADSFITNLCEPDNELFAWGSGENGQLGLLNNRNEHNPKCVETLCGITIEQLAAGWDHSMVLSGPPYPKSSMY